MTGQGEPLTRVYIPTTVAGLQALAAGSLPVSEAFAVTERLRVLLAVPAGDPGIADELAQAAVVAAADAALVLLAGDPAAPRLRVVVVADAATTGGTGVTAGVTAGPGAQSHPAAVALLTQAVPAAAVACLLADDPDDPAVAAAVAAAVTAQGEGTEAELEDALDILDDHVLAWFDVTELPDLIDRLQRG